MSSFFPSVSFLLLGRDAWIQAVYNGPRRGDPVQLFLSTLFFKKPFQPYAPSFFHKKTVYRKPVLGIGHNNTVTWTPVYGILYWITFLKHRRYCQWMNHGGEKHLILHIWDNPCMDKWDLVLCYFESCGQPAGVTWCAAGGGNEPIEVQRKTTRWCKCCTFEKKGFVNVWRDMHVTCLFGLSGSGHHIWERNRF